VPSGEKGGVLKKNRKKKQDKEKDSRRISLILAANINDVPEFAQGMSTLFVLPVSEGTQREKSRDAPQGLK